MSIIIVGLEDDVRDLKNLYTEGVKINDHNWSNLIFNYRYNDGVPYLKISDDACHGSEKKLWQELKKELCNFKGFLLTYHDDDFWELPAMIEHMSCHVIINGEILTCETEQEKNDILNRSGLKIPRATYFYNEEGELEFWHEDLN